MLKRHASSDHFPCCLNLKHTLLWLALCIQNAIPCMIFEHDTAIIVRSLHYNFGEKQPAVNNEDIDHRDQFMQPKWMF